MSMSAAPLLGRPGLAELERFAETLADAALGTVIERVWRPTETSVLIELRGLKTLAKEGHKPRLYVDLDTKHPWVAVTHRWPDTPASPDRETLLLRKHLEGRRVLGIGVEAERRLVLNLHDGTELVIQLAGRYPQLGVTSNDETLVTLLPVRAVRDHESPPLRPLPLPLADLVSGAWLAALSEARWTATDLRALESRREHLLSLARAGLEKKRRTIAALEKDLARMGEAESLRQRGELLKTALHRLEEGTSSVEVINWSTGEPQPTLITLDPTLSPVENLQRVFDRYKKLVRGATLITPHLEAAWDAEQRLLALLTSIPSAAPDELISLEESLADFGLRAQAPPQKKREAQRLPYRRFESLDGTELLVGRSARDNDSLTFHVARGSDIFLHARDVPGSHVILRRKDRTAPPHEALLDAATLAAFASRARHDTVIDVLWTERKHVRKVKGAAPGLVQTAATRNIAIRIDNARIERLYRTLDPHERDA